MGCLHYMQKEHYFLAGHSRQDSAITGSQSHDRILFILPAHRVRHIISTFNVHGEKVMNKKAAIILTI